VNEGMRDRKEKKKLREDERGGHEFRKSTECSGLSLRSLSHNDICLTDYSQLKKKTDKSLFSLNTFVFISVCKLADLRSVSEK